MIDQALRDSLAAFDDEALATLANPGLVRRAQRDLEEGKLRLVSTGTGVASVEADGQLVTIDTRGPRAATCACKSVAICRHRIAATIFLRASPGPTETEWAADAEQIIDPADIVAGLEQGALERWTGKAAWRAAWELVETATSVTASANSIAVEFAGLDDPVRILRGQGFDGIVSKAAKARRKPYHAAAMLAAWRHIGQPLAEPVEEPETASIEVDPAFLQRVQSALRECALLGFNIAPLPLEESLFELSVSSRADSLPRLSSMLRALAAQLHLRRQRSFSFDPDAMLELAASGYALTRTLAAPDLDSERFARLAGSIRRSHAAANPMTLVGCGGERWRTEAGARGVTAWFHEPATGRWLSASIARGAGQDPMFSPSEAWRNQTMWHGGPLAELAHARIMLTGAGVSADSRLSSPAEARALVLEKAAAPDASWPAVIRQWSSLRQAYHRQAGLGLEGGSTAAVCLIDIQGTATAQFDELAQQLIWPVRDVEGEWLGLALDHEEPVSPAIEALEARVRTNWKGMALIRLAREAGRLAATPLTLFDQHGPVDLSLWQRPWRASADRGAEVLSWFQRLRNATGPRLSRRPARATDMAIASAWRLLLDRAEIGTAGGPATEANLKANTERLEAYGLSTLASLLRQVSEGQSEALLAAAYGLVVARQQRCDALLLH